MAKRIWNLRLNLDEFNSSFSQLYDDAGKAQFLHGFASGCNGGEFSQGGSLGFQTGWKIGNQARSEAEAFVERKREGGIKSARLRAQKSEIKTEIQQNTSCVEDDLQHNSDVLKMCSSTTGVNLQPIYNLQSKENKEGGPSVPKEQGQAPSVPSDTPVNPLPSPKGKKKKQPGSEPAPSSANGQSLAIGQYPSAFWKAWKAWSDVMEELRVSSEGAKSEDVGIPPVGSTAVAYAHWKNRVGQKCWVNEAFVESTEEDVFRALGLCEDAISANVKNNGKYFCKQLGNQLAHVGFNDMLVEAIRLRLSGGESNG